MEKSQNQKLIAISLFTISMLSFGNGLGHIDSGLNFLNIITIIFGLAGSIISANLFFSAKK